MRLTEREANQALILSEEELAPRSPGLHVSTILRHIDQQLGKNAKNDFTEADLGRFALVGRLWEAQLAAAAFKPPRYARPGEIECEGIIGSPDAVDTALWAVQEYKVTWKSANNAIESFHGYWRQMKAYCYMLGMTRASLHVFFVNGHYKPPCPIMKAWDAEFTAAELRDNWQMLKANIPEGM